MICCLNRPPAPRQSKMSGRAVPDRSPEQNLHHLRQSPQSSEVGERQVRRGVRHATAWEAACATVGGGLLAERISKRTSCSLDDNATSGDAPEGDVWRVLGGTAMAPARSSGRGSPVRQTTASAQRSARVSRSSTDRYRLQYTACVGALRTQCNPMAYRARLQHVRFRSGQSARHAARAPLSA